VIPEFDRVGAIRRPSGSRLAGIAPSNLFAAKGGEWVIVAANQDTVFRRLCRAIGRAELAEDPRFATHVARGIHQEEIEAIVAEWVAARTAQEACEALQAADVVAGFVYTAADIVADPQFRAREMIVPHHDERVGEDVLGPGIVPKFSATPGRVRWAGPPVPGAHNDEVFGTLLGLDKDEISLLERERVL
jgi:formyl-CoA transferase